MKNLLCFILGFVLSLAVSLPYAYSGVTPVWIECKSTLLYKKNGTHTGNTWTDTSTNIVYRYGIQTWDVGGSYMPNGTLNYYLPTATMGNYTLLLIAPNGMTGSYMTQNFTAKGPGKEISSLPASNSQVPQSEYCTPQCLVGTTYDATTGKCETTCPPAGKIHYGTITGDARNLIGGDLCTDGKCSSTVIAATYYDEIPDELFSSVTYRDTGLACSGEPEKPPDIPTPKTCKDKGIEAAKACGAIELIEKFECNPEEPENAFWTCKKALTCEEKTRPCEIECGGAENIESLPCVMIDGKPQMPDCICKAPPVEKGCDDARALCEDKCGPENPAIIECIELPDGQAMIKKACECEYPDNECPKGRICDKDGYCQPGEDPESIDCKGDNDKDGCANGEICERDGICQKGEDPDSRDCGGNNDGTGGNDPTSTGGGSGGGGGSGKCPDGAICSSDGVCQQGENAESPDCKGTGEGTGGGTGEENGGGTSVGPGGSKCPPGEICHGDGKCQANEAATSKDCAGLNFTQTRFATMTATIKESGMFRLVDGMKIPAGGSSAMTVDLGDLGGGSQGIDFEEFSGVWAILRTIFYICASWVSIKIILLKGN